MDIAFDTPVMKMMRRHRSIRQYKPDPLPDGMLEAIISSAQTASTSSYLQQYSVVVVEDSAKKDRLTVLCGNQEPIRQCPTFLVFCADRYRLKHVCECEGTQIQTGYLDAFLIAAVDAALLAQNVALAAESLGLGIVYIGGIRDNPAEVIAELELPELVFPITGMCLGYPAEDPTPRPRLPLPSVLHRERYYTAEIDAHLDTYDETVLQTCIFLSPETGEPYGWISRAARRMAYTDPMRLRVALSQVAREQGFGLQ